jgi:putative peptide zinc metalloprotease protein
MTSTQETSPPDTPPPPSSDERLRRADNVEMIGEYDGSGYREPPLIARRGDGQVVQLSELLYAVLHNSDGQKTHSEIATAVSEKVGKDVSEDNVRFLADKKLRPLGVLKLADGSEPKLDKTNAFLALKFRTGLVPDRVVRGVTSIFQFLYWPPVLIGVLVAFGAFDYWLFVLHGVGGGIHQVLYQPALVFLIFGLLVVATAFHEIGHASACRYGGAEPGTIGAGIYLIWPAFYTDVTDAYRLGRWGRVRVDLGGVYFNAIFILVEAGLYWYTGFEPILIAMLVQHLEMVHQFLPFVRLDGYYLVSDLVGVPDLFQRMKPILKSMNPAKDTDPRVKQLKPKVRFAVTAWVLLVIPILLFQLGMIVFHAPRIFGTAWDSLGKQAGSLTQSFGDGAYVAAGASVFQIIALAFPVLGITYMLARIGQQAGASAWRHSDGRPVLRGAYGTLGLLAIGFIAWTWLPNGDYAPIRKDETWNFQTGLASFRHAGSGKAGLVGADPNAAEDPFNATPTAGSSPASPSDTFDSDTDDVPSGEVSDADPETRDDPFFDPSPSPAAGSNANDTTPAPASAAPTAAPTTDPTAPTTAPQGTP